MEHISIVIPIYKGKKYIQYWREKIENNYNVMLSERECCLDVILVNDYPDEIIEEIYTGNSNINIRVFNMAENQGIHGARVFGALQSQGEYLLFIDQDDEITDNYMLSQIKSINDYDAIVCNGYIKRSHAQVRRKIYANIEIQKSVSFIDKYIDIGNQIVSPGQVLIKKNAIPRQWLEKKMKKNGADDFYLWLLMLKCNKKIGVNSDFLYTHINGMHNTSNDVEGMKQSVYEVINLLNEYDMLSESEIESLKAFADQMYVPKFKNMFMLYDSWLYLKNNNKKIDEYLKKCGYSKVAVYGMNYIGNRLYDDLLNSDVEVMFGIDRDADSLESNVPIYKLENKKVNNLIQEVDVVIVTVVDGSGDIEENIRDMYDIPVLSLNKVIGDMITGM